MSLDAVSISFELTGDDNDGRSFSETTKGSFQCKGAVESFLSVTDTPVQIWDVSSAEKPFGLMLIVNEGDADGEVRIGNAGGSTFYSLAIPVGATVTVGSAFGGGVDKYAATVHLAAYTSQTTTFRIFTFT